MSDFLQTLSVPGAIWRMAGPNILISLIMLFYNITDTFFISLLHDDLALAAVGITFPCLTISLAVSSLLTVGSNSLVSRCIGAGDYAKATKTGSDIFGLALLTGLFLCIAGIILQDYLLRLLGAEPAVLPYAKQYSFWMFITYIFTLTNGVLASVIKAQGYNFLTLLSFSFSCLLNLGLDYFFMFVCCWGVMGAALATSLATVQLAVFNWCLLNYHTALKVKINLKVIQFKWKMIKEIIACGISAVIGQVIMTVLIISYNRAALYLPDSQSVLVAITVYLKLMAIQVTMFYGYGQAVLTVMSYALGAKNKKIFYQAMRCGEIASVVIWLFFLILFAGCADWLLACFTKNAQAIRIGSELLLAKNLLAAAGNWSLIIVCGYQAFKLAGRSTVLSAGRQGLILIPCLWLLSCLWGLTGLVWASVIADGILFFLNLYYRRDLLNNLEYFISREVMR
ncbi:MAG: MATE family efflux transporter [bacterium]